MISCSFDYLIYPYYPAYTMGCYQFVISSDNKGVASLFVLLVYECNYITKGMEMQPHFHAFPRVFINRNSLINFRFERQLHTNYFSNCIRRSYCQFTADICACCLRPPVCFLIIFPTERPEYRFFVFLYFF